MGQVEYYKGKVLQRSEGILQGLGLQCIRGAWRVLPETGRQAYCMAFMPGTPSELLEKAKTSFSKAFRAADSRIVRNESGVGIVIALKRA